MPVLATARLELRELDDRDAPFILELLNDPDFLARIGDRGVRTLDDARTYIESGPRASYALHGYGLWLVRIAASGESAGICGLVRRPALDDADLGFAFLPQYRRSGHAQEAAAAVLDYAHRELAIARVIAIVQPANGASIRLLERLGFRYERNVRLAPDAESLRLYGRGSEAAESSAAIRR